MFWLTGEEDIWKFTHFHHFDCNTPQNCHEAILTWKRIYIHFSPLGVRGETTLRLWEPWLSQVLRRNVPVSLLGGARPPANTSNSQGCLHSVQHAVKMLSSPSFSFPGRKLRLASVTNFLIHSKTCSRNHIDWTKWLVHFCRHLIHPPLGSHVFSLFTSGHRYGALSFTLSCSTNFVLVS